MTQSIFITGGTSGIGLACADEFKSRGYRVGVCGRNTEVLDSLKEKFETFKVDVTDKKQIAEAVNSFSQKGLDIIFANAGIGYDNKTTKPDFDRARKIIDVNINGVLNTLEPSLDFFYTKGSGHIVVTGSIAGLNGLPGVSAYSGSKAAIIKICESLSLDLKDKNINVTCVNPGFIDTPLTQKNNHSMPFLASSKDTAIAIANGIEAKKSSIYFPRFFSGVVQLLSMMPRAVYKYIISKRSFNYSNK